MYLPEASSLDSVLRKRSLAAWLPGSQLCQNPFFHGAVPAPLCYCLLLRLAGTPRPPPSTHAPPKRRCQHASDAEVLQPPGIGAVEKCPRQQGKKMANLLDRRKGESGVLWKNVEELLAEKHNKRRQSLHSSDSVLDSHLHRRCIEVTDGNQSHTCWMVEPSTNTLHPGQSPGQWTECNPSVQIWSKLLLIEASKRLG